MKKRTPFFQNLSARTREKLQRIGLVDARTAAFHMPIRYDDQTTPTRVQDIRKGQPCVVEGTVVAIEKKTIGSRKKRRLLVTLKDDAGTLFLIRFVHAFPSLDQIFVQEKRIRCFGSFKINHQGQKETVHPEYVVVDRDTPFPHNLTAVYTTTAGLTQKTLRKVIHTALSNTDWTPPLPNQLYEKYQLPTLKESLMQIHFPPASRSHHHAQLLNHTHPCWKRLKFDELLAYHIALHQAEQERSREQKAVALTETSQLVNQFLKNLSFHLTRDQEKTWQEIRDDLGQTKSMYRLLQGDVSSGKTVVAVLAALMTIDAGYQVAFMAPTEILAEQHFIKMASWFEKLNIPIALLHSSTTQKSRHRILENLKKGATALVVGTHALFQKDVQFDRLALVVMDEQHRFGVAQRLSLWHKGQCPHQLMMSATPIPRTLAMAYAAYLSVSTIKQLPAGRQPIDTHLFQLTKKEKIIELIKQHISANEQVYWVCPLIEDSEKIDLVSVLESHQIIQEKLPDVSVALLHGKMKSQEKAAIMSQFARGTIQVLVTTTVIEVGIDVPNDTVIVIEQAEQFGLAQLHQLRGRVGRGTKKSHCLLLYNPRLSETGKKRLRALYETQDGFILAEKDLDIRGPGQILGHRQSGLPQLKFSDLIKDRELSEQARQCAQQLLRDQPTKAHEHHSFWLSDTACYLNA